VEEALDVEWIHAIAPGAQIVLVEANSQSLSDLMAGVATAAKQPGVSVVSMSWGFPEGLSVFASDEATYDSYFATPGVTYVASTGDYGAFDPEYPAFSPNVVAVGGTSLTLNADNSYKSETGWGYYSDSPGTFIGGGGGISQYETEPAYQQGVQSLGYRTTPDVAMVADPATGAWIADLYNLPATNPFEVVGGTSLSAPAWTGLLALVNQGRVAAGRATLDSASPTEAHQALYSLPQSDYTVISSGTNGYHANPGYNLVTGLGTPAASTLVSDLVAYHGPNTTYSGPTVGPLQDATLYGTGSDSGGPLNVFAVFSAVTVPSSGLGFARNSALGIDVSLPRFETMAPMVASPTPATPNLNVTAPLAAASPATAAGLSITPTPASLTLSQTGFALTASPSSGHGSEVRGPWSVGDRGSWSVSSGPVDVEGGWMPMPATAMPAIRWRNDPGRFVRRPRAGLVLDSALDELASDLGVRGVGETVVDGALSGSVASATLVRVDAAPPHDASGESDGSTSSERLSSILMAAGFVGLGAGLMAARKPKAKGQSAKRSVLAFRPKVQ
jgi:hypothetical protein